MSQGRSDQVRRLGSTVINGLFLTMTAFALLGWLVAPFIVPVIAHGFPPTEQNLVLHMVRWMMPGIVATSISGACAALLNANHRFLASALVYVAANVVTIGVVIVLHAELGIFALVLGSLLGLFAQVLVQLPSILRYRLYRFELDLRHPGLAKTLVLLLPAAVGSGAAQISIAFDRYFASTLSSGSTAALDYTTKLAFLPIPIVAGAISTVIFPVVAGQFASSDRPGIRRSISFAMRMVGFIVIPCAAGLIALSYPIVQTLFERGAFGPDATARCASLIPFACVPLVATSYNYVLGWSAYACKKITFVVAGSSCALAINVVLSATLLPVLGAGGLLLANGVAGLLTSAFLIVLLSRSIGKFEWPSMLSSLVRIALASLGMALALHGILSLGYQPAETFASRAWYLTGLLAIGAGCFLIAARLLGVEEFNVAVSTLAKKFGRGSRTVSGSASGPLA